MPHDPQLRSLALAALTGEIVRQSQPNNLAPPEVIGIELPPPAETGDLPSFLRSLNARSQQARLLNEILWVKSTGKQALEVTT